MVTTFCTKGGQHLEIEGRFIWVFIVMGGTNPQVGAKEIKIQISPWSGSSRLALSGARSTGEKASILPRLGHGGKEAESNRSFGTRSECYFDPWLRRLAPLHDGGLA